MSPRYVPRARYGAGTQSLSTQLDSALAAIRGPVTAFCRDDGLRIGWRMTKADGQLATAIVKRYRERYGHGPTLAKAHIERGFAVVVLGDVQTEVERSLVAEGEVESVELLRRRIRQMAADEFCAATEEVLGRKVLAMLGDHNARANASVLLFLLEPKPA
jgi:uncharacterized protein YbcI